MDSCGGCAADGRYLMAAIFLPVPFAAHDDSRGHRVDGGAYFDLFADLPALDSPRRALSKAIPDVLALMIPLVLTLIALPASGLGFALPDAVLATLLPTLSLIFSIGPACTGAIPIAIAGGYAFLATSDMALTFTYVIFAAAHWATFKSSVWYLEVFVAQEQAAANKARAHVAEERLHFAADLHDVMGQRLAAISLHTQIAQKIASQGKDVSESLATILELTDQSTRDLRQMVSHYREPQLQIELDGAISLLKAAGATVEVRGMIRDEHAGAAALVIREATTNILKHSNATNVVIEMSENGIVIRNNGLSPATGATSTDTVAGGTGLRSLRARIAPAQLETRISDGMFILEVRWSHEDRID